MYSREIDGEEYTFGVSGKLIMNVPVTFGADTASGVVFSRNLDGQTLTFTGGPDLVLTDEETGSTWDGRSGLATDGLLAGQQLERIKSTRSFWFGWKDFYPETRIYGLDP